MDGEEALKSPLPHAILHEDSFLTKMLPFLSEVKANNGGKMLARQGSKLKNSSNKVGSIEEIQSEVEAAVRKVISTENSRHID